MMSELKIDLKDFAAQLSRQTGKHITLRQTAANQITAHYLFVIPLDLLSFDDKRLLFAYRLPWGAGVVLRLFKQLKSKKFSLDANKQTVWLHLDAFAAFAPQLTNKQIVAARLEQGVLYLNLAEFQAV